MLFRSRRIRFFFSLFCFLVAIFWLWRLVFFAVYFLGENQYAPGDLQQALYLGAKFDIRLALDVLLLPMLLSLSRKLNPVSNKFFRKILTGYFAVVTGLITLLYITDFAYFGYLGERLDRSVFRFLDTPDISLNMVWESYPVIWLTLLVAAMIYLVTKVTWYLMNRFLGETKNRVMPRARKVIEGIAIVILFAYGWMGKIDGVRLDSVTYLRWSEAYFTSDFEVAALGVNPVLFFFSTWSNAGKPLDVDEVKKYYPEVAEYLGIDEEQRKPLVYRREFRPDPLPEKYPNIVLVMLESLGANRLGAYGNPLQPTPNLDALIRKSWWFPNFYVPASGTARTVWGKLTGIPDVSYGGTTATRNPKYVNQRTVLESLPEEYQFYYFLGGSANWANMRALLQNNLKDVHLVEEGDWKSPNVDVWGISDRSLFTESHEILEQRDASRPFFAVIQTAANHRPFTIPEDDSGFAKDVIEDEIAKKHGFLGSDQYNAVRLLDFNIGYYFNELVKGSSYERDTIFLLYGDHNDKSNVSPHLMQDHLLGTFKHHVPFIMYSPTYIKTPEVIDTPMSLVDMVPTALGVGRVPYVNYTLGRDVRRVEKSKEFPVLVFGGDRRNRPLIGVIGKDFYFHMLVDGKQAALHDLHSQEITQDVSGDYPEVAEKLRRLTKGLYLTSRYLMEHNKEAQ